MTRVLTDSEINGLLAEGKPLPPKWTTRLSMRQKADEAYTHRELVVRGSAGHEFRIVLRGSTHNPLDFSLILLFVDPDGSEYRLTRFNGRHPSQHTNKWEKSRRLSNSGFRNRFHIHRATERYQLEGFEIDGYAEVTDRYDSYDAALDAFVRSNGFVLPPADETQGLFDPRKEPES
jgi:hypothetical protein